MKHTPGPWKVKIEINEYNDKEEPYVDGIYAGQHKIVETDSGYYPPEMADALLIAAAPEMYAACKAAIAYNEALKSCANDPDKMSSFCTAEGDDLDLLYESWIRLSAAAIVKAEDK